MLTAFCWFHLMRDLAPQVTEGENSSTRKIKARIPTPTASARNDTTRKRHTFLLCHLERNEVESKDLFCYNHLQRRRFLDFARNDTQGNDVMFHKTALRPIRSKDRNKKACFESRLFLLPADFFTRKRY